MISIWNSVVWRETISITFNEVEINIRIWEDFQFIIGSKFECAPKRWFANSNVLLSFWRRRQNEHIHDNVTIVLFSHICKWCSMHNHIWSFFFSFCFLGKKKRRIGYANPCEHVALIFFTFIGWLQSRKK